MTDPTVMFFDQYQRYHTAAEVIRALQRSPAVPGTTTAEGASAVGAAREQSPRILEVGANEHRDLGKELPDAEIWYTDLHLPESMEGDDHCFTADATDLKDVEDNAYDFCVAMDVFEHIPKERRKAFLTELYRVCKTAAVICFPYNAPAVVQAEHEVNEMHCELFGEDHPWLIEHMENGLPDRAFVDNTLTEAGIRFTAFTHGSVAVWKRMLVLNYFAEEEEFAEVVTEANLYYNRNLYDRDCAGDGDTGRHAGHAGHDSGVEIDAFQNADYRVFYILEKSPKISGRIRNPFAGRHLSDADLAPVDNALNRIAG